MLWLDRIAEHDAQRTVCEARAGDAHLWAAADGSVPGWIAVEWMAQAMAVHGALGAASGAAAAPDATADPSASAAEPTPPKAGGGAPPSALLAGASGVRVEMQRLPADARVRVEVVHERGTRVASFACRVTSSATGELVAAGRLQAVIGRSLG